MSRDPALLHPEVRSRWEQLATACLDAGIVLVLTQTRRTVAEQDELYASGRTKPGKVVTNARGLDSLHVHGRAFDIAFRVNGEITWDGPWSKVGAMGEALGLQWGGRWRRFPDRPHFQYLAPGESLASLKAASAT